MRKVLILVEGQTEELFVKRLLAQHLAAFGLLPLVRIVATRKLRGGGQDHGGYVSYGKLKSELLKLLGDTSAVCVTTMLDLYGLPSGFPGSAMLTATKASEKAEFVERAWAVDVDRENFLPYLQVHEFEALLFSSPQEISATMDRPDLKPQIERICRQFPTPEDINDKPETSPSHRLKVLFPEYKKVLTGIRIAERIGLQAMRSQCPHFDRWIGQLERLGTPVS